MNQEPTILQTLNNTLEQIIKDPNFSILARSLCCPLPAALVFTLLFFYNRHLYQDRHGHGIGLSAFLFLVGAIIAWIFFALGIFSMALDMHFAPPVIHYVFGTPIPTYPSP